ncbi:MAG: DUF1054 family protein [Acidobacteria bacterium]|uniref:DUF1054 family protein n=1 Tax=Candidatus Polarisedimenticola svalbardensis TaxID=2886004 RepID=A0A8J7C2M8_9BACT|nr:DUF1054 family protein [Candidatus Polarisedimenticola svalbardensis]
MSTEAESRFEGLPLTRLDVFDIPDVDLRRQAIIEVFHPPLLALGNDLLPRLQPLAGTDLHIFQPRLNWPRSYKPFCTWMAISREKQGYQACGQLNVGAHRDYVAVRLGWDASVPSYGRFEFLSRYRGIGDLLQTTAREHDLQFRVYSAAPWPVGSELEFVSKTDLDGAFAEVRRHGVWFEIGRRYDLPLHEKLVASPAFGDHVAQVFESLMPVYLRAAGRPRD